MNRSAETSVPIHSLVADRWSPVGFDGSTLALADLTALFEAARWAASAFNEQPWRFLVARREDTEAFAAMLDCLVDANQSWARNASALIITTAATTFERNSKPNATASYDLGLAVGGMSAEATARGLVLHQMGGILPDRVRETYGVPSDVDVVTGIAVGRLADPGSLDPQSQARDTAPRVRRPLEEFVFTGGWGRSADLETGAGA